MSDNEIEKAILEAMKETAPDLLRGEKAAKDILTALRKLEESSGGKLRFTKGWWDQNGDIVVTARDIIVTEKLTPAELVLKITPLGEIFTNVPLYPPRPDETEQTYIAALHRNLEANGADEARKAEILAYDHATVMDMARDARDIEILQEDKTQNRKDAATVLADLAMRAVFQGRLSQKTADAFANGYDTASPAQRELAKGLAAALRAHAEATQLLKNIAEPFLKGFSYLQRLSLLNLDMTEASVLDDRSAVVMQITANAPFKTLSVKITQDGKIKVGTEGIPKVATYDVLDGRLMEALKDIAMSAVFAGKIHDAPEQPPDDATAEQKAVLEGIYLARLQMEMTADAAKPLIEGLDRLKELSKGGTNFVIRKVPGSSDIEIRMNPGEQLPQTHILVSAAGTIMLGDGMNGYNPRYVLDAANEDEVSQLLRDIARASAFRGEIPLADNETDAGDLLLSAALEEEEELTETPEAPAQQAVRDGIREAAEAMARTKLAAESLDNGLKFLKDQLRDDFNYATNTTDRSRHLVTLNPDSPAESYVVIEADGTLKSGYDEAEYNAWKDEDVARVMADVTRNAMLEASRKALRKPGMF